MAESSNNGSSVLATIIGALGLERARQIPGAVRRLAEETADAGRKWLPEAKFGKGMRDYNTPLNFSEVKPYDILLSSDRADVAKPSGIFGRIHQAVAGARDHNAYMAVPDDNGTLRTIVVGGENGPIRAANKRLMALSKAIPKKFNWKSIAKAPSRYSTAMRALEREASRVKPIEDMNDYLRTNYSLRRFLSEPGTHRVLTPKVPLTELEQATIRKRLPALMGGQFSKEDIQFSGLKNFLFGPGKRVSGTPSTCAGGICSAYDGIRDLGGDTRAIPLDFRTNPNLVESANFRIAGERKGRMPSKAVTSQLGRTAAKSGLVGKSLASAVPLAISGAMLYNNFAKSSHTKKAYADLEEIMELARALEWRAVPDKAVAIYTKYAAALNEEWATKSSESPTLRKLVEWLNLTQGTYPGGIPNHPGPLAAMLVGGLAGAGLGYGAGALGETVMPSKWKRGRLRKTLAALGGVAGTAPGAIWGAGNMSADREFNDSSLFQQRYVPGDDLGENRYVPSKYLSDEPYDKLSEDIATTLEKVANIPYTNTGMGFDKVPVNEFNQIVWGDPRVYSRLNPPVQAAATGLVTGAANLAGRRGTTFVTPSDIGRLAAGMGSGYLSGMLVGKALGTLMGMPEETQDTLKNTGLWAGVVANIVPIAFGG